jgi:hypothetical protein
LPSTRDAALRPQARDVVLLELDAPGPEGGDDGVKVVDLPAHLRVGAARGAGRREQREAGGAEVVGEAAGTLLGRLQAELLGVPAAGALQVLAGEPGGDRRVGEGVMGVGHRGSFGLRRSFGAAGGDRAMRA